MPALCILAFVVLSAAVVDARTGYIPDRVSLGGVLALMAVALCTGTVGDAVVGAGVCSGALALLFLLTHGRGLGFGDVKLALAIGAGLGPAIGLAALGLAFIIGACIVIVLLAMQRTTRKQEVYFAPYLAAGTVAATCAHIGGFV